MGKFLDNRLKYHTASRVAIETQQPLAAAMNVDGHVVTDRSVWTSGLEEFPLNSSSWKTSTDTIGTTSDLVSVFTNNRTPVEGKIVKEVIYRKDSEGNPTTEEIGYIWTNSDYPAVKLFDRVEMEAVPFSDGPDSSGQPQAYHILDASGIRVTNWVPCTSVIDPSTGSPCPGYSGIAEVNASDSATIDSTGWTILQQSDKPNKTYKWALAEGTWEFVFLSGMLVFDPSYTPTTSSMGYKKVRWTGFQYKGTTLDNSVKSLLSGNMAIKPFGFSFDSMTLLESEEYGEHTSTHAIEIAGFVFMVVNDVTGISFGDIEYLPNGSSKILFFDVDSEDLGTAKNFTAYAFTKSDGSKINILKKTIL